MTALVRIASFAETGSEVDRTDQVKSPLHPQRFETDIDMNLIECVIDHLTLGLEEISADISQRLASARNAALARRRS